jgi:hypothetical protein
MKHVRRVGIARVVVRLLASTRDCSRVQIACGYAGEVERVETVKLFQLLKLFELESVNLLSLRRHRSPWGL